MAKHFVLGHVVLNVSSLARSVPFYRDVLGLREVARRADMVFFSFGANHHDIALREVPGAAPFDPRAVGLLHLAICIGTRLDELRDWKAHLQQRSVGILRARDHRVSQSIYFQDPDGIVIEAYVDGDPSIWRDDPSAVATILPFEL